MKTAFCILFSFLFLTGARAEFTFYKESLEAQKNIFSMKLDSGSEWIAIDKKNHPENGIPYLLENYVDVYRIFVSEDKKEFDRLFKNKEGRLDFIKKLDKNSPYYLYIQGEINLQWAFAQVKFGHYMSAALEIKKAYNLLEENSRKFPDFKANHKSLGLLKALVGNIPESYKWIANLLAFKGNTPVALRQMEEFVTADLKEPGMKYFQQEAAFILSYLQIVIKKDKERSWQIISRYTNDYPTNLFSCFTRAYIARASGRNDVAIDLLMKRPRGKEFVTFYYLDYMLGECKLFRQDKDADVYLKKYVSLFSGNNYIKDAYEKLAWHYLLNNSKEQYSIYMLMVKQFGIAEIDEDKRALRDAESGKEPNLILLKSRLLFDGAYYAKALSLLEGYKVNNFTGEKDRLEYVYRKARIYHECGNYLQAIDWYTNSIKMGTGLPYYYAANSSLQLGLIYEKLGSAALARSYFEKCFEFGKHEYKTSIEQKAKIGLRRLLE